MDEEERENASVESEVEMTEEETLEDQISLLQEEIDYLKDALEEERARAKEYLDAAKRIQAEFDNYKKRLQREKEQKVQEANEKLICEFLSIMDDFERAIQAQDGGKEFQEGIRKIHNNILNLLEHYGVSEIEMDDQFNPELHEALSVGEGEDGRILEVYQKGYRMGNRILRCPKVKVGRSTEKERPAEEEQSDEGD
ncbi:MAG: nucleotide exchange factor GrpE [Methanomassiliicoccales archaeon]